MVENRSENSTGRVVQHWLIPRPRVDEILARSVKMPVVTVSAGQGYAKHISVAGFLARRHSRAAWLNLTQLDNIPGRFWENLTGALAATNPTLAKSVGEQGFPETLPGFDDFVRLLAREAYSGRQVIVVLEDYNTLRNRLVLRFIESLIETNLENFCLILISSGKIHLDLLPALDRAGLFEITAADLKYTPAELEVLFAHHGLTYNAHELAAFCRKTDGWPFGVNLLVRHCLQTAGGTVANFKMPDSHSLFDRGYYANYSPALQQLLVKLTLLASFNTELIAAIGGCPVEDAIRALQENLHAPYQPDTGMYQFSNMYRAFLERHLPAIPQEEIQRVYSLAGDWFSRRGMLFEAAAYYDRCGRFDDMFGVILRIPLQRKDKGTADFVLYCLDRLPEGYADSHPMVSLTRAAMLVNNFDIDGAVAVMDAVRAEYEQGERTPETEAMLGELYLMMADVSIVRNSAEVLRYYQLADACLPGGSHFRDESFLLLENENCFYLLDNEEGALGRTQALVEESTVLGARVMNGSGYGLERLYNAEAAFMVGDYQTAGAEAYHAIYKAREKHQHDVVCNAHCVLMWVAMFSGRYSDVMEQLNTVTEYIESRNLTQLFILRDCAQIWFYNRMEDDTHMPGWVVSDSAEALHLAPISYGRVLLQRAAYLLQQQRCTELVAMLARLERYVRKRGQWMALLHVHLMRAISHMRLDQRAECADALYEAYKMSHKNGVISPFIEYGSAMRALVDLVRQDDRHDFDPAWLTGVQQKATTFAKRLNNIITEHHRHEGGPKAPQVSLTKREQDVLRQLAQGLTREEIGVHLDISVNTVKSVIKSIYCKLDAVNRADAVHIANAMGLL